MLLNLREYHRPDNLDQALEKAYEIVKGMGA